MEPRKRKLAVNELKKPKNNQRVWLFGGAFDPPHIGHRHVVEQVLAQDLADQVWIVPSGSHPFSKNLTSAEHRQAMLDLTFDWSNSKLKLITHEIEQAGVGYSFQTLQHFQKQFPDFQFTWLIGSDNVAQFGQWHAYQEILATFSVAVYPREQYVVSENELLPGMQYFADLPTMKIASSQIRQAITNFVLSPKNDQNLQEMLQQYVTSEVARYIEQQALYTRKI